MHTPPGFVLALLLVGAMLAGTASADQSIVPAGAQPFGGELTYMADAARFTDCRTGRSHPVALEGDWIAAERAYVAAAREPAAPVYVTFDGTIADRPKMEGDGVEPTVVVQRFIHAWPHERCERARADASLSNTYWRIVRLGAEAVRATPNRREPHLVLRSSDGRTSYTATVGCNQLTGWYTVNADAITFSPAAATLLPCPPPLDTQEKALGAALARTRRWRVIGNTLELFDDQGTPSGLFEAVYL